MAIVYDIEANKLIEEAAKELAKSENIKAPDWSAFVKTGTSKERPPAREDWWFVRAAAILRTMYTSRGPIGVQKLRVKYGSKKNRGHKPEKFFKASGKIIRLILQQLEKDELIKKSDAGVHKGRIIAAKGRSILDKAASVIVSRKPKKEEVKKEAPKKEEPKKEAEVKKDVPEKKDAPKEEKKEVVKEEVKKEEPKKVEKAPENKEEVKKEEPLKEEKKVEKPKEEKKKVPKEPEKKE